MDFAFASQCKPLSPFWRVSPEGKSRCATKNDVKAKLLLSCYLVLSRVVSPAPRSHFVSTLFRSRCLSGCRRKVSVDSAVLAAPDLQYHPRCVVFILLSSQCHARRAFLARSVDQLVPPQPVQRSTNLQPQCHKKTRTPRRSGIDLMEINQGRERKRWMLHALRPSTTTQCCSVEDSKTQTQRVTHPVRTQTSRTALKPLGQKGPEHTYASGLTD